MSIWLEVTHLISLLFGFSTCSLTIMILTLYNTEQTDVHKMHFNCLVENIQKEDDDKVFFSGHPSCANGTGNMAAPMRTCEH